MMNDTTPSKSKHTFLFGIRVGEKNKTYTLGLDACCSSEAIAELKAALMALEEKTSHFIEGENNTMMIGNVAVTLRYKRHHNPATPVSAGQSRREAESATPRTVFPLPQGAQTLQTSKDAPDDTARALGNHCLADSYHHDEQPPR